MVKPNDNKPEKPKENLTAALGLSEEDVPEKTKPKAEPAKITKDEIVHSDDGVPLFKRLAPTISSDPPKKIRPTPAYKAPDRQEHRAPSANAALLQFPTDRWGICKDLKKAMIHTASRIAGDANKKALVKEILGILEEHLEAKFIADQDYKRRLAERNQPKSEE